MSPPADHDESFDYADGPGDFDEQLNVESESLSPVDDDHEAFQIGTTGRLIGKCGPKMSGQLHYYLVGGIVIVVGFAVMIGLQVAPGAADPATASKLGFGLGGGLVLFGGAIIALQLIRVPQIVSLYDDRLEEVSGSKLRTIRLDQVIGLHLQEFYEHRFAPQTFLVTVRVNGDRNLKFSTALGDDANLIVRCLADIAARCRSPRVLGIGNGSGPSSMNDPSRQEPTFPSGLEGFFPDAASMITVDLGPHSHLLL